MNLKDYARRIIPRAESALLRVLARATQALDHRASREGRAGSETTGVDQHAEPPPIVYVDQNGDGWTRPPNWQEAAAEDIGQHDIWKGEMRVFLWRCLHDHNEPTLDLEPLGLGRRRIPVPVPRMPMPMQLAEACRRLGFVALAQAATPDLDIPFSTLALIHAENEDAVEQEAQRRWAKNQATAAEWDDKYGALSIDSADQTRATLSAGDLLGRPDAAPLQPIRLLDPEAPPTPSPSFVRSR